MIVSNELITGVRQYLGAEGLTFFKRLAATYENFSAAVWMDGRIPHPVHFREGMLVRNFMRQSGLCETWTDEEFDNHWVSVVLLALKEEKMLNDKDQKYIENTFMYHVPKDDQPKRYEIIRSDAKRIATVILELCPESRERSLALTKLEEAIMWANASIARNE